MDFRTLKLAMPHPDDGVDFRAHPEPYKSELLPLWACRDLETARRSAEALYARYLAYREAGDFVGMDMARKYLQMGYTRARRYANHRGGRKRGADGTPLPPGTGDPTKAEVAEIFRARWRAVADDPEYRRRKALHQKRL